MVFWETESASAMSRRLARDAADRARSQANKTLKGATEFPGGERKERGGSACQQASDEAEVGLAESDSEIDTSDPGGMPQLFREPRALGAGLPETLRMLLRRWTATRGTTPRPVVVAEPQVKARGPTLLKDLECKVCTGGTSDTSIVSRAIAQGAGEDGDGEVGSEAAVQGAEESSTSDDDEGGSGFGPVLRARADSSPAEVGDSDVEAPTLGQPPGEHDEFARELANTMSAIANLVVKASGRSINNGGWLYFSGAREDYRSFRAKCQLFHETYHRVTPQKSLVDMFREWNLAEEVARHIKGAGNMQAAWGMLDAVYDGAPIQMKNQGSEVGRAPELQGVERAERMEAGAAGEERPAPPKAGGEAVSKTMIANVAKSGAGTAVGPQEKHVFIYTLHGIRRLKCLWANGREPEHTVVSHEAAKRYSLRVDSRKRATRITGPTWVTVGLDTDHEIFLLMDDLPGRTTRALAHGVESVGEFCGVAGGAADEYEVQLGKDHVELLQQLQREQPHRTGATLSERWGETIWRLPVSAENGGLVWINTIRSYRREESEITRAACRRLCGGDPKEGHLYAMHVRTIIGLAERAPVQAWIVGAIGPLEPGDSPDGEGQNPVVEGAEC